MTTRLTPVSVVVEGSTDSPVAERLLKHAGLTLGRVYGLHGKSQNDLRLPGYNTAARLAPWLVLRDMDNDAPCAPELVKVLLPRPSRHMRFRIAVRAMEAWLIADPGALSTFLSVPSSQIPANPDDLADPKREIVRLAQLSTKVSIRRDMVPRAGSGASVGPGYGARIMHFVAERWRPAVAATRSPSLAGCIKALSHWP